MTPRLAHAAAGALIVAALSACGSAQPTGTGSTGSTPPSATPVASSPSAASTAPTTSTTPAAPAPGAYVDYATWKADPARYADGTVVLFFHADWCPKCRDTDENLASDPASLPAGLTVVKADFDSETDLRQTYGVTVQHTFVQVAADGTALATWTGTYTGPDIAGKTV